MQLSSAILVLIIGLFGAAVLAMNTTIGREQESHSRPKRHLVFRKSSKMFFRLNIKANVIKDNPIFAHAYGFRANYDLPDTFRRHHRIVRRDVYQTLEDLISKHGFDGRACVLKTLCDASKIVTPQSGILFKLFKMIFTIPKGDESSFPYLKSEQCEELGHHCPMSLLGMTTYTDT